MNAISAPQGFSWSPQETVFAGIWTLLLGDSASRVFFSLHDAPLERQIVNAALFGGTFFNALHWADSVQIFSLGLWSEVAKTLGYGTSAIVAFLEGIDAVEMLLGAWAVDASTQWSQAFCALVYRATTLAWSILGVISFFVSSAALATAMNLLFLTSFLFFIGQYVYLSRLLEEQEARERLDAKTLPA